MTDKTLFQNLLIFLKQGKFELSGEACLVFNDVYKAVQKKLDPPLIKEISEPIKKEKAKKDAIME